MSSTPLPTLHTPRLTLRPMTVADTEGVYKMIVASQASFGLWFNWAHVSTRATVKEYLHSMEEAMAVGTAWHYVILSWTGHLVGRVGLTEIDPVNRSAELGYMLRTDVESNGLMNEAARSLLEHAFGPGGLHRISAYADVENEKSQRVLTRLGFRHEGTVRHALHHPSRGWRDHHVYGLLEGELRV
jgi:ribosomal-protein-alanine N-acetyltransferase